MSIGPNRAIEFGLSAAGDPNSTGLTGLRDGNGIIEGGGAVLPSLAGETALFWPDLGKSGLISGTYPGIGSAATPGIAVTTVNANTYMPHARLRNTANYYAYSTSGLNWFFLGSITTNAAGTVLGPNAAVTALEAKGIDEKIDDGMPLSGVVRSMMSLQQLDTGIGAPSPTTCISSATVPSPAYNVSSARPTTSRACSRYARPSDSYYHFHRLSLLSITEPSLILRSIIAVII